MSRRSWLNHGLRQRALAAATQAARLTPGSRTMSRALGWLMMAGCLTFFAWLLLPHPSVISTRGLIALATPVLVLAALLIGGVFDERPPLVFEVLMAATSIVLSIGIFLTDDQTTPLGFLVLWVTPYAFVFCTLRRAALQLTIAGGGMALALAGQHLVKPDVPFHAGYAAGFWLVAMTSTVAVGVLARCLSDALRDSDTRLRRSFNQAAIGMALVTREGRYIDVNDALCRILERHRCDLVGKRVIDVTHPADRPESSRYLREFPTAQHLDFEKRYVRAGGETVWARVSATFIAEEDDCFFCQIEDITDRKQAEADAETLARDNALILESAGDGIYRIDLDGDIVYANPACAHLLGYELDELLGRSAHELMHHSRQDGSAYPLAECPFYAAAVSADVTRSTEELFWRKDGSSFTVDHTTAPVREHDHVIGAVCVFADISDRTEHQRAREERAASEGFLQSAFREDRVAVFGQPILNLRTDEVVASELLIRIYDAQGELIMPSVFLPVAERHGQMRMIDRWMIGRALGIVAGGHSVTVNISAQTIGDEELLTAIETGLARAGRDRGELVLEITETAAVDDLERASVFATRLSALGCRVALDDFGAGFGGFNYLKRLDADYLKIDGGFVADLVTSESDQRIVKTIVGLAREFGLRTIAEGVENSDTLEMLRDYGVDLAQGYHIQRPAPLPSPGPTRRASLPSAVAAGPASWNGLHGGGPT